MKDKHNKLEEKWGVNKHTKMTKFIMFFFPFKVTWKYNTNVNV